MENGPNTNARSDRTGSIDIPKELDFLKGIRSSGVDTTEMEQLLFSDIDEFFRRKRIFINYQKSASEGSFVQNYDQRSELDLQGPVVKGTGKIDAQEELPFIDLSEPKNPLSVKVLEDPSGRDVLEKEKEGPQSISTLPSEKSSPSPKRDSIKKKVNMKRKKKAILVMVPLTIVLILIISYVTYLLLDNDEDGNEGKELNAEFLISDSSPSSGGLVSLDANFKEQGSKYEWTIFPEYNVVTHLSPMQDSVKLYFKKAGTYRVDLRISYDGKTATTFKFIDVTERTFVISRERYSDSAKYNVSGDLYLENVDSILRTKDMLSYRTMFIKFWTLGDEPMESTTGDGLVKSRDGLLNEYLNLQRGSTQNLEIEGWLERANKMRSPLTGSTRIDQSTFIDVYNKRPSKIMTSTLTEIQFQAIAGTTVEYRIEEKGSIYTDLATDLKELRVEDISEGRDMKVGMEGTTTWGTNDLEWEAVEVDMVNGMPALELDLTMPSADLRKLDLKDFHLSLWLANGIPVAVKTVLNISSEDDIATPYKFNHLQEMVQFVPGTEPLIYGDVSTMHETLKRANDVFPVVESEFHDDWSYVPNIGNLTSTVPSEFTAQDAIAKFEESPDFKAYKRSNPSLYGTISNYSKYGGKEQWRFSLAEKGDELAWNQTVRRSDIDVGFPDDVEPVDLARTDLGSVLSFSGAEHCLKQLLSGLEDQFAVMAYGASVPSSSSKIDTSTRAIGTRVDMRYPMVGLINPGLIGKIPLCLYIESFDGSFKVGFDMENGQLAFVTSAKVTKL